MLWLLDRTAQLTNLKRDTPYPEPLACETALEMTALAATLLFAHGQTTERTVVAAERLAHVLGVAVTVLPYWGELIVKVDGAPVSHIVPAKPLGVDMGRVLAVTSVIDQICHGELPAAAAQSALESAGRLPPASTPRFTLFAAIGAASLGVIFSTIDAASLLLIAASAAIGALVRRWLSGFSHNSLIQPLCAALIAGVVAATASRFQLTSATTLVAFSPCMVLVPGPHILNGAIDLARTRIALGLARLTYAGIIVLLICAGGLFGFTAAGGNLAIAGTSPPAPLIVDAIAAGCAVASLHVLLDAVASAGVPDRGRRAGAYGPLGADLSPRRKRPERGARRLHTRQYPHDAGGRSPASALCGCRLLRRRLVDAGLLPVQYRNGPRRVGLNRSGRAGGSADQYRRERRHGISDHHGHGLRADPPAHAVRAPLALPHMTTHGRSMRRSAIQEWCATPLYLS
jgi:uncharacterized membrane protein YjjP (DUF1212 family)